MYALNTNPDNYQVIYPSLTNSQQQDFLASQLEREIHQVVASVRHGENSWLILADCIGYSDRAIRTAIERGLIIYSDGLLTVPVVEVAPAAPATQQNVEEPTEQYVKSDIGQIDQQIQSAQLSKDPAVRLHRAMLEECTGNGWWDNLIAEAEIEMTQTLEENQMETLEIPGLKCKNLDRPNDPYWFFVGTRQAAFAAIEWLKDLGIYTGAKPNGSTGCYCVQVPRWVKGNLIPGQESQAA